ncbi:hypothetical protein DSCO28_24730 [Desulfosarcina ovata subsp. sediminis]|uniref:2Fe-2S ferredoxin-type domain-containing protein n=1 Tax=Desulfosarcina ovata subsp. sediminis TaxID=885957 RepID=A0A5K7ZNL5_9BACT|nr:ASKHA domain-containing protein [Desulfosarcina ovata]BBO81907.1 hypothetical protein DSCO28_24730 [Desulfosarcina ovata subsp. sediminis]
MQETVNVNFVFDNHVFKAEKGMLLSEICSLAGYPQDMVCGGKGTCGKCVVEIIDADQPKTVLSCQYPVVDDIIVQRIVNPANRKVKILTANTRLDCRINPDLSYLRLTKSDFVPDYCSSFAAKLLEKYQLTITYPALKQLSHLTRLENPDLTYTLVTYRNKIIDAVIDEANIHIYGVAIDIGTTTVVCYLYDMTSFTLVGTYSALNQQTELGADVITRIHYCVNHRQEQGINVLRRQIVDTINDLLNQSVKDGVALNRIYQAVLCGNSTMQHLFLGLYPESLGMAPFVSMSHDFMEVSGREAGLQIHPEAAVTFLPLMGAFVGADTMSVLVSLPDDDKVRLIFDLGTNGEIACGSAKRYMVTSTACGPALEGAGLACGMRASAGAIQHFHIDENKNILLDIIDDASAIGICGSGIIDIYAELLKNGVINARGRMLTEEAYENEYGKDNLSCRLARVHVADHEVNAFILAFPEENGNHAAVYFTQLDAREIQKAKGAIAAGCRILTSNYGISIEEVGEICLAGAFGNYLDIKNAQFVGLLPQCKTVAVHSIGNGAGTGVQLFLLDKAISQKCRKIQKNAVHQELNLHPDFNRIYLEEMQSIHTASADAKVI